jgi:hypothetical protein
LGTSPKSVMSGQVYDLAAFIDSDSTPSKPPKAKPKPVEVCESCKRPL